MSCLDDEVTFGPSSAKRQKTESPTLGIDPAKVVVSTVQANQRIEPQAKKIDTEQDGELVDVVD